jgi:phosphoglycolate phosphatase
VSLLILWNVDLTLVDVTRVIRAAYAQAFAEVTGRPLVQLPQMAGRSESEMFFDALALNDADMTGAEDLLEPFIEHLAHAMAAHRDELTVNGQAMPGAADAIKAVAAQPKTVQSVLTGTSRANAALKLTAFGLHPHIDFEVGGYGDEAYPKGTLLRVARQRASDKYRTPFIEHNTVYIADSPRDVEAARVGGASSIAVATGRATATELRDVGADAVLQDLTDTAALLALLGRA